MYRMGNQLCMQQHFSKLWNNRPLIAKVQAAVQGLKGGVILYLVFLT